MSWSGGWDQSIAADRFVRSFRPLLHNSSTPVRSQSCGEIGGSPAFLEPHDPIKVRTAKEEHPRKQCVPGGQSAGSTPAAHNNIRNAVQRIVRPKENISRLTIRESPARQAPLNAPLQAHAFERSGYFFRLTFLFYMSQIRPRGWMYIFQKTN